MLETPSGTAGVPPWGLAAIGKTVDEHANNEMKTHAGCRLQPLNIQFPSCRADVLNQLLKRTTTDSASIASGKFSTKGAAAVLPFYGAGQDRRDRQEATVAPRGAGESRILPMSDGRNSVAPPGLLPCIVPESGGFASLHPRLRSCAPSGRKRPAGTITDPAPLDAWYQGQPTRPFCCRMAYEKEKSAIVGTSLVGRRRKRSV